MKVLFLLLGTITLAMLALPEANAMPADEVDVDTPNSLTDKIRNKMSDFLKKVCDKLCDYLKENETPEYGIKDQIKEKVKDVRDAIMKKCNCP